MYQSTQDLKTKQLICYEKSTQDLKTKGVSA